MDDLIVGILNAIGGSITGGARDILELDVGAFNETAFAAMENIAQSVVKPVSAVILAIMLVVELARVSSHIENDNQMGVKLIAGTMFKFVLLIVAVQHAPEILGAMNEIASTIIDGIAGVTDEATDEGTNLGDSMKEDIAGADVIDKVGFFILVLLPFLVASLGSLIALVVAMLRFVELYLLSAFATLPVAFMANPETKSVAVGYLRHYAAAALHGATLMLALYFYSVLTSFAGNQGWGISAPGEDQALSGWAVANFGPMFLAGVLLIALVLGSNRMAKALVGL